METLIFGHPFLTWQILASVGVFFIALEIFLPSFIMLPIGVAFLLTAIASVFVFSTTALVGILGINLAIVFFVIKKVLKLKITAGEYASNKDSMVGQKVEVTEAIEEGKSGYVKLYGDRWQATMDKGSAQAGDQLKIISVEGNKVVVGRG